MGMIKPGAAGLARRAAAMALAAVMAAGFAAPCAWAVAEEQAPPYFIERDEAYMLATFDKYDPEVGKLRSIVTSSDVAYPYYKNELVFSIENGLNDVVVNDVLSKLDVRIVSVSGSAQIGLVVQVYFDEANKEGFLKERLLEDGRVIYVDRPMAYVTSDQSFAGIATLSSVSAPGRVLDVQWGSDKPGAPLQLFDANATAAQRFRLLAAPGTGCYSLVNVGSGLALDVPGGDARPGAAIWQHPRNGTDAQLFALEPDGEGAYVIHPRLDPALALDLRWGGTGNGTALQLWESNGPDAQRFRLDMTGPSVPSGTYALTSALGTALDAAGNGGAPGTNVQAWAANGTSAQAFTLIYDAASGYYVVVCAGSGLALDVAGGSAEPGANAQLWPANGTAAQRWALAADGDGSYALLSAVSGMALDVTGGSAAPGANMQLWSANGTAAQRWLIAPAAAG